MLPFSETFYFVVSTRLWLALACRGRLDWASISLLETSKLRCRLLLMIISEPTSALQ